ncbi:MAG: glycosyltransferase [Caldilineales bacterium]|nr:glycosyltransferase [Caldilineales bacterium]
MRIAHFTNTYKPNINGVVRSVSTYREALSRMGHQVFVLAQRSPKYKEEDPFVFRYPAVKIPGFDYSAPMPTSRFVDKLLPPLKLDIIHSNHPTLLGDAAAHQAERLSIPLIFTFHTRYVEYAAGYAEYVPFAKAFMEERVVDALAKYLERCHHVITPSDSIKEMLANYAGITDRVTTIPTGIDVQRFQSGDGGLIRQKYDLEQATVLVSVSRLADEKNVKTLLRAAASVMKSNSAVWLLLIGDGPQRKDLEGLAESLGIARRVIFTGLIPFDEVPNYLHAGDVFCYASITETQGLVTVEAMAAGLPIVAVGASGTSDEVSDGREGLLTANDPDTLAQAIGRVLDDRALYERLRATAAEKAHNLDMMVQAERMLGVYETAIADHRANRRIRVDRRRLEKATKGRA